MRLRAFTMPELPGRVGSIAELRGIYFEDPKAQNDYPKAYELFEKGHLPSGSSLINGEYVYHPYALMLAREFMRLADED